MALNSTTEALLNDYILECRKEKRRRKRMMIVLLVLTLIWILFSYIGIAKVNTSEMGESYQTGDIVIYEKRPSHYNKNDVVFIHYEDKVLIRRIVGVYKDKIDIDNTSGILYINNQKENSEKKTMSDPLGIKFPLYVSKNQYFVICDQRNSITDSRKIGCVHDKDIIGKVIYKIRF